MKHAKIKKIIFIISHENGTLPYYTILIKEYTNEKKVNDIVDNCFYDGSFWL